jgi:hypothetical protein
VQRLRPAHGTGQLTAMYPAPHDHTQWPDHVERVTRTIALAHRLAPAPATVADLSCGDAVIARSYPDAELVLGDLAPGYPVSGPIEDTIRSIRRVELFVCCETIEHLDDPAAVLAAVRGKAQKLVLSTPLAEWNSANVEHYWAWDADAVRGLLEESGWFPVLHDDVLHRLAAYQIWGCV